MYLACVPWERTKNIKTILFSGENTGGERKRSFRSDEAKAEEPERTLFFP